ncbi:hypothetical protein CC78DRAFT_608637, partial [Lojkania enalia]
FDYLRIDENYKVIIRALVYSHIRKGEIETGSMTLGFQDIINGKAKGLILLLHVAPRVCKTAIMEALARETQKPLFAITCGDLSHVSTILL